MIMQSFDHSVYYFILYQANNFFTVLNNIDAYLILNSYQSPWDLSCKLSLRPCQAMTFPEHTFLSKNTSTRHPVCNHLIKLHELDHLKCHQWTRLGNQQIYSIIIQADLSCGSTIHLTSIDVILLSSPKVHTYTWILL